MLAACNAVPDKGRVSNKPALSCNAVMPGVMMCCVSTAARTTGRNSAIIGILLRKTNSRIGVTPVCCKSGNDAINDKFNELPGPGLSKLASCDAEDLTSKSNMIMILRTEFAQTLNYLLTRA